MPWNTRAEDWNDFFLRARQDNFMTGTGPEPPPRMASGADDFYPEQYLNAK
jgi:hypothetical protein